MKYNVLHLLYSSELGGAEKVAIDLISSTEDICNSMYVSVDGGIKNILDKRNINNLLLDKISYGKLKNILINENIDIIHAHDFRASLLASMFSNKYKVISHIHQSPPWFSKKNLKTLLYNLRINNFTDVLVTSNEIKRNYPFDSRKFQVIENVVNVPKLEDTQKKIDFLFVGRLENDKNPLGFIDFIDEVKKKKPDVSAAMIGQGSLHNDIKQRIDANKNNIDLIGFLEEPYEIINQSNFLVVTSLKEGFGLAMIESMQLGVPVITKKIGGVTDKLDSSNAIILESFDINSEYETIINLLSKPKAYQSIAQNAIKLADTYRNNGEQKKLLKELYKIGN